MARAHNPAVLCGFIASRQTGAPVGTCLDTMASALSEGKTHCDLGADNWGLAGSAPVAPLAGGGAALLVGEPRWQDPELEALASVEGHCAALARAYAEHDEELTELLRGPFSLVVVDAARQRVVAAIDRTGQHQLYYCTVDGGLVFASTLTAVVAHPAVQGRIGEQGIFNYVYFHMVPGPGSIFVRVNKLQAAQRLVMQGATTTITPYWLPTFSEHGGRSENRLADELKQTLRDAIKRGLGEGKRVGAFLSGGLDSSSVAGMLSEVSEGEAEAFAIGFDAEGYDEMAYARITARHFGLRLHEYYVTPEDVVEAVPRLAQSYDEPFGNSSALPAWFCARLASEHGVERLLAGDGGDELFAGNERYAKQQVFERYLQAPEVFRKGLLEPLVGVLPDGFPLAAKARSFIAQANVGLPDRLHAYNFLHRHAADEVFTEEFLQQVDIAQPLQVQRDVYKAPPEASTLNRMLYLDWQFTLADNDLRKVSHMCDLAGVEVSYPMLDDELLEFSTRIPSRLKLRGEDLRHFYKRALTGWLPEETINKKKHGFGLPFGVWMRTHRPLAEMAYDNLLALKQRNWLNAAFIDNAIRMHREEHAAYYGSLVWILMVLELWARARIDGCSDG